MRTFDQWMAEYGASHQNPANQLIHKICVPLIMFSVIGFLMSIPVPVAFKAVPFFNWSTIFIIICLAFYLLLNFKMFVGMVLQTLIMVLICEKMQEAGLLLEVSFVIFVLSWIAQFWGHKIEGKKPSFLQDLVFLLIGPLWVTRFLYKKIGISV